ncbi:uracil-DNA glycosylase family protein [Actinomycetospora sp. CA-084318]|uniref:uracil-DNA glycosylase family protein n=1 Tax=Actinomycetospora sp. CA-084318 TaxID=3239892 RepID=UPI003D96F33A
MESFENDKPWVLDRKRARLHEPHIAPLVSLADRVAAERGLNPGAVPYPDPDHGGTRARVLFVLSHPGAAAPDTRFLSLGNPDSSAWLCLQHCVRVGLPLDTITHWNAVPFPIAGKTPSGTEKRQGAPWLRRLVDLLPDLEVVCLLGAPARDAWPLAFPTTSPCRVVEGPSPGPPRINHRGVKEELAATFDEVAAARG